MRITVSLKKSLSSVYLQQVGKSKKSAKNALTAENSRLKVKIGLEIHARIQSNTKIFSDAECRGNLKLSAINSQVAVFDAAHPGTMPTLNRRCVEASLLTALALNCRVNCLSSFERKHYFYADLPAGYQITQQKQPVAFGGLLNYPVINPKTRRLTYKQARISRIQLEHDSARSLLTDDLIVRTSLSSPSSTSSLAEHSTLIDLNRVGMGLMEIVTEPDFDEAFDSYSFARELALTLRSLGTCEAQMSDGGFRVDVNVSVHETDPSQPDRLLPGVRVELKNLNSFNAVLKATEYEIERQKRVVSSGGRVDLETRTYDSHTRTTVSLRSKEDQYDYRFMPEPNLLPLLVYPSRSFQLVNDNNNNNNNNNDKKCINNPQLVVTPEFLEHYQNREALNQQFFVDFDKVKEEYLKLQLPQTRRDFVIERFNLSHENAFVFVANNLDLLLIEIEHQLDLQDTNESNDKKKKMPPRSDDIAFISKLLLFDYLQLVNQNVELDRISVSSRAKKIVSYARVLRERVISPRVKDVVFKRLFDDDSQDAEKKLAADVVRELDLYLIEDESRVNTSVDKLFEQNPQAIDEYKRREKRRLKIFDFFVGRVHKDMNDRADPDLVDRVVLARLKKLI